MRKKTKIPVQKLEHDAAHIAGHPSIGGMHPSLGKNIAIQVGAGVAAGVGTYQVNRKLAHVQHDTIAPPSPVTGGMPNNTGANVSNAAKKLKRKGGS